MVREFYQASQRDGERYEISAGALNSNVNAISIAGNNPLPVSENRNL